MGWKRRILARGRAYSGDRALKKDSGFREPRFQETRKTRGQAALDHCGKGLRKELGRKGSRKAENKAFTQFGELQSRVKRTY